jgi:hypothetical protein
LAFSISDLVSSIVEPVSVILRCSSRTSSLSRSRPCSTSAFSTRTPLRSLSARMSSSLVFWISDDWLLKRSRSAVSSRVSVSYAAFAELSWVWRAESWAAWLWTPPSTVIRSVFVFSSERVVDWSWFRRFPISAE